MVSRNFQRYSGKLKKLNCMNSLPVAIRRVQGLSMLPTLKSDQIVLAVKTKRYSIGDIVIFSLENEEMIKRIIDIKNDLVYLLGDNSRDSLDSRRFGWIGVEQLK